MGVDVSSATGLYPVTHSVLLIFSLPRHCVCVCLDAATVCKEFV